MEARARIFDASVIPDKEVPYFAPPILVWIADPATLQFDENVARAGPRLKAIVLGAEGSAAATGARRRGPRCPPKVHP